MIEFSVHIPAIHESADMGAWVLAIDREGVLVAHEDQTLRWYPLGEVRFLQMRHPFGVQPVSLQALEQPIPTFVVAPPRNGKKPIYLPSEK